MSIHINREHYYGLSMNIVTVKAQGVLGTKVM